MEKVKFTVNGQMIEAPAGSNLLEACLEAGIFIPHLCYHPELASTGECGLCAVEISGKDELITACDTPVSQGLVVYSESEKAKKAQLAAVEKILAIHPADCGTCIKYLNCELQSLKQFFAIEQLSIPRRPRLFPVDERNPLFVIDPNKCVLCERCVKACRDLRGVGILSKKPKGDEYYIGTEKDLALAESGCRFCGACAEVCPTGAILDRDEVARGKKRKKALLPCRYSCPAEIDVAGYLRFIRAGDYASAAALIREKVPFPALLGYICNSPCEKNCRRGQVNQPVSIRDLKRYVVENDGLGQATVVQPASGRKVAIVGSGPAGLTAAHYLAKQGHAVTVFEKEAGAGGMPGLCIPAYRLPAEVLNLEIENIRKMGVSIRTGVEILSVDSLFEEGFNAVLIAVGTHLGQKLPVPGAEAPGVWVGIDFLRRVNRGESINIGQNVLVLGGGSVAYDCARSARRLGAQSVSLACLESIRNMPAAQEEIIAAQEEAVAIFPDRTFTGIRVENGHISGVECHVVESLSFDEDNQAQIEIKPDSYHILAADTVIFAIGQRPAIPETLAVSTTARGLIEVDPYTLSVGRDGVFAAGDAVNGTSSVIQAIASGRKAAVEIDRYLNGSGDIEQKIIEPLEAGNNLGLDEAFIGLTRVRETLLSLEERMKTFRPVVCPLTEDQARQESGRCLQCDLRLKIKPIKFWSSY
ncbi:MAG TPA: FAD-dependent oxidoreductase [Dehalococcoidales bacterium]|nr:FAD-dependent oxidoreductase [Dehalococcoidales bacterium]